MDKSNFNIESITEVNYEIGEDPPASHSSDSLEHRLCKLNPLMTAQLAAVLSHTKTVIPSVTQRKSCTRQRASKFRQCFGPKNGFSSTSFRSRGYKVTITYKIRSDIGSNLVILVISCDQPCLRICIFQQI